MLLEGKSEKVGIMTLYHGNLNFGGLLQAYALPFALHRYLDIPAEQIDYAYRYQEQENTKDSVSLIRIVYSLGCVFFRELEKKNLQKRNKAFQQFIDSIPHSEQKYGYETITDALKEYAGFICGGDQIWNDYHQIRWYRREDSNVFTLQFVPEDVKKISYAPSMAISDLTDDFKDDFCKGIKRLDAISLREGRSLPVLQELTDQPITVTVDPVLLLEENEWQKVIRYPKIRKKYVLCYLLGDSYLQRKAVSKYAQKLHLPVLTFPHILTNAVRKCDLFFGDIHDYTSGPREFLGLIKNAEFVITDSYHACVFSMIFQTPFAVFERHKANETENMNSRIYDFLEEYHLDDQLVTEDTLAHMDAIPKIDFSYAHKHWKQRREESLQYLENALKDNKNGAEQ